MSAASERRVKAAEPAEVDITVPIPSLGASIYDVRNLASYAMGVIGVNQRADDGCPTELTIYRHGLTSLVYDLRRLAESLEEKNDELSVVVEGFCHRIDLINQCATILADVTAARKGCEEPSK